MRSEDRRSIRRLIERALEGKLSLQDLYEEWPDDLERDALAQIIYDDIESAVEHFPLDQNEPLLIDCSLLDLEASSDELLRARRARLAG